MLRTMLVSVMLLVGCSSIPNPTSHLGPRLTEPNRSNFVMMCVLNGQLPVTACLCFEEVMVKLKGNNPENYTQLDMAVAQQKCMEVLEPVLKNELQEMMEQQLLKERKESI